MPQTQSNSNQAIALLIFGGSGDLTFRKLLPAMYNHFALKSLNQAVDIIPIGRRDLGIEGYREQAGEWVKEQTRLRFNPEIYDAFSETIHYFQMDFNDMGGYEALDAYLSDEFPDHCRVFYYAVGPDSFHRITLGVSHAKLNRENSRMILEKPFGDNLVDAKSLNAELVSTFGQDGVYHIDHYLGKEMIRNILSVRFGNAIFSGIWNHHFIDNVQINAFETVGVETRGGYYDQSGAFRDMVQNHLFQVLSVIALEQPIDDSAAALHDAQYEVLKSLKPINGKTTLEHLVLGQYAGYRNEPKVDPNSETATYAAIKVNVDSPRWKGVPFYIRTGKKLHKRDTEIIITFRQTAKDVAANILVIKVQPDEGIYLRFNVKKPGTTDVLTDVHMDYCQSCNLENYQNTPEAYERLLAACFNGDHTLFSRWDQIEASWNFANQLLAEYEQAGGQLYTYEAKTPGPVEAELMLGEDGREWVYDLVGDSFVSNFNN